MEALLTNASTVILRVEALGKLLSGEGCGAKILRQDIIYLAEGSCGVVQRVELALDDVEEE